MVEWCLKQSTSIQSITYRLRANENAYVVDTAVSGFVVRCNLGAKEVASRIRLQEGLKMDKVLDIGSVHEGFNCVFEEWWKLGSSWEAASKIHENAPKFLEGRLKRIGLPASVMKELPSPYGMRQ